MKVGDLVKIRAGRQLGQRWPGLDDDEGYGVILQIRGPPQRAGHIYNVYWSMSSKMIEVYGIDLEVINRGGGE
jgi:hypothetical protein